MFIVNYSLKFNLMNPFYA